jgi:hypothetical protein
MLTRPEKILVWFALITGALTVAATIWLALFSEQSQSAFLLIFYFLLGSLSILAGYYGLAIKPWAFWLLFGIFAIQLGEYFSHNFFFSFIGPFAFRFELQWGVPPTQFNLNPIAAVVCLYSVKAARGLTRRSSGSTQAPPAEL